jgi:hypothetical protein
MRMAVFLSWVCDYSVIIAKYNIVTTFTIEVCNQQFRVEVYIYLFHIDFSE